MNNNRETPGNETSRLPVGVSECLILKEEQMQSGDVAKRAGFDLKTIGIALRLGS